MIEKKGDIWESGADLICVTTNGMLKKNGNLVMGAGIAKKCAEMHPHVPEILGKMVKQFGNKPYFVICDDYFVMSFPTKHDWRDKSDIQLIIESAKDIKRQVSTEPMTVALPRVGCGNGGLDWDFVKQFLKPILDDRFVVYYE